MTTKINCLALFIAALIILTTFNCWADSANSFKKLIDQYPVTSDKAIKHKILKELKNAEPVAVAEVNQLRILFSKTEWDENLFIAAMGSVRKIKNVGLDVELVGILQDEKGFIEKAAGGDFSGRTQKEAKLRVKNAEFIINKLGELKSNNAIPILKEYLQIEGMQYASSEALGMIGDKSTSEGIRERAYRGEEINYGGLGIDEARRVVQDLTDKGKKDKWAKISKQLILIKDPRAKPYLRNLFNHEKVYVRERSATVFSLLLNENDISDVLEMAKNKDKYIKCSAIDAMKRIKNYDFSGVLIDLLKDPEYIVRLYAAKTLGYKNITNAIPQLEKALNDEALTVREQSFVALYIITGKKYDFKGRDANIDQLAERQKKHPSFY